jgi:hypothetical protein
MESSSESSLAVRRYGADTASTPLKPASSSASAPSGVVIRNGRLACEYAMLYSEGEGRNYADATVADGRASKLKLPAVCVCG